MDVSTFFHKLKGLFVKKIEVKLNSLTAHGIRGLTL